VCHITLTSKMIELDELDKSIVDCSVKNLALKSRHNCLVTERLYAMTFMFTVFYTAMNKRCTNHE